MATISVTAKKTTTANTTSTNPVRIHGVTEGGPDFNLNYKSVTASRVGTNIQIDIKGLCLYLRYGSEDTFFGYYYGVWPEVTYGVAGNESTHQLIQARRKETITSGDREGSYYIHAENAVIFKPISGYSWSDSSNSNKTGFCPKDNTTWDATIIVSGVPNNTNFVNITFRGDSFTGYIYNNTEDANGTTMAAGTYMIGCPCTSHEGNIGDASIEVFWTGISGGSIAVSDNKNKVKITGTNFKNGDNNNVASSNLQITFKDSSGSSLNTPYVVSVGTTSEGEIDKSINIADVVDSFDLANVAKVDVKLVGTGDQDDTRTITATTNPINIKYYTCPAAPSSLWYESNGKSSLNDTFTPSYKKDLTWNWSGAAGGTNAPVKGYRAFFVNETKSVYIDTDIDNITATDKLKTESSGGNPCYETTGTNMSFNPQTVGFDKNETCTCHVYTYSTWGNGDKLFSNNASVPEYPPGDRAVKSAQCTFSSGAVVWIKIPKPDDPDTLEWKEGTVYVHNGSAWKEAEGVYVHNGSGWKEST